MRIAFDVDQNLVLHIPGKDIPNYKVIDLYRWFESQGHILIIWSGAGPDYAKMWADKLGLVYDEIRVKEKSEDIDISVDDQEVDLAKINIQVR